MNPSRKIMITGVAGFIGSHLARFFVERGHQVIGVDNLLTGRIENIRDLESRENFKFLERDIIEELPVWAVDIIFNMACPASPPHYQRDPIHTLKTNVYGVNNVLELALKTGAKVFHASTSEVYGDPLVHPQPERYWGNVNPCGIRSCYDEGKRAAEALCFDYQRKHGVDVRVGRIFNTYGPNMDPLDGRVVSNFIMQAIHDEDITIYGDGSQTRSFCYVTDLLDGILGLVNMDGPIFEPYNLGNPTEFTIKELADLVITMTDSNSRILHFDLPQDDPTQRRPDISKARADFGFEPRIPLSVGIRRTEEYFRSISK